MQKGKKSKYKSEKCEHDGIKFDSIAEGDYYLFLKKFVAGKFVDSFELQPKYIIHEKFNHPKEGNVRAIIYKADFLVKFCSGVEVIVDVKGLATPEALLKRKMFLKKYPELDLRWIAKSLKYGDNGWIDYFELKKIRLENKKKRDKLKKSLKDKV